LSSAVIPDDVIQRLVSKAILTGHEASFSREALGTILDKTPASISDFAAGRPFANEINTP
jgi:D-lactate dehydrogenase